MIKMVNRIIFPIALALVGVSLLSAQAADKSPANAKSDDKSKASIVYDQSARQASPFRAGEGSAAGVARKK